MSAYYGDDPEETPWWVRGRDFIFAAAFVGLLIYGLLGGAK